MLKIYEVEVSHKTFGKNWTSYRVHGRTFDEALRKARTKLESREVVESMTKICECEN